MLDRGFAPDFSPAALREMSELHETVFVPDDSLHDLRALPWASID